MKEEERKIYKEMEERTFKSEDVDNCSLNYKKQKDLSKIDID